MFIERINSFLNSLDRQAHDRQYLINCTKDYLQLYVLEFIYNSQMYRDFIFTGGTALQKCFGLDRMSEDIDIDSPIAVDHEVFVETIREHFQNKYRYSGLQTSIKGKQKKIYLKFPVLRDLDLSKSNESDQAYVKVEIVGVISENYKTRISVINRHNVNVLVKHYELPDLFAGKLHAVLTRTYFKGSKNEITFKGRDYYDLLWFLNRNVRPNMERLNDLLEGSGDSTCSPDELKEQLKQRVHAISAGAFLFDVQHFFQNSSYIKQIAENYKEIVLPLIDEM